MVAQFVEFFEVKAVHGGEIGYEGGRGGRRDEEEEDN
jgi:hypothetical protein